MKHADQSATPGVELLRRSYEAFNRGDLDACVRILRPDFVANVAGVPEPGRGREPWKRNATMFREAFPDLTATIEDIFGSGDLVAVRLTFRGTHRGDFLGIAATDRTVAFSSLEFYRLEGDQLAEEWVSPDVATLLAQLS